VTCLAGQRGRRVRYPHRTDIPAWWQETRGFYCPWENSGAGGSLMKYRTHRSGDFKTFDDLDTVLDDAEKLGTNVIYLVGWWEPEYEYKAEYETMKKWGGDEAFKRGVAKVHARGGRVICYLEPFIISRKTELAREVGAKWAMMDESGKYYSYYDTGDRFYLMQPGRGTGWTEHLVALAERLARDFKIDGVHLDSYGLQWDWKDYHPDRPWARDPKVFNQGAIDLVKRVRAGLRKHVPDAVVILEGAENTELLDVCDGAQFENLVKLRDKPWFDQRRYPIFTSSFELEEMQAILDEGYHLALSPWWFTDGMRDREIEVFDKKTDKRNRFDQLMALHKLHNILLANDALPRVKADFDRLDKGIIARLNKDGWGSEFEYPPLVSAARRYLAAYHEIEGKIDRTPADVIREMVNRAEKEPFKYRQ
jgi:hypothetical protein